MNYSILHKSQTIIDNGIVIYVKSEEWTDSLHVIDDKGSKEIPIYNAKS